MAGRAERLFIGPDSRECGDLPGDQAYKSTCKDCSAARARGWYAVHTEQGLTNRRRLQLKQDYGLTPEEYDELLAAQGGVCAICRQPETTTDPRSQRPYVRLPVDHCHETGRVRGLLCHRCNRAIGLLRDDVDLLRAAIAYLEGSGP